MIFKLNQYFINLKMYGYRFKHGCIDLLFICLNWRMPTREEYLRIHNVKDIMTPEVREFSRVLNMTLYVLKILNIDPNSSDLTNKLIRFSSNKSKSKCEVHYIRTLINSHMSPSDLLKHLIEIDDISDHKLLMLNYPDTREKLKLFLPGD